MLGSELIKAQELADFHRINYSRSYPLGLTIWDERLGFILWYYIGSDLLSTDVVGMSTEIINFQLI